MKTKLLLQLALAGLVCTAAGCDPYGDICERESKCQDGNDADTEACVVRRENAEERASLWDCDEYYDKYFECLDEKADCENDVFHDHDNKCQDESEDLDACM